MGYQDEDLKITSKWIVIMEFRNDLNQRFFSIFGHKNDLIWLLSLKVRARVKVLQKHLKSCKRLRALTQGNTVEYFHLPQIH